MQPILRVEALEADLQARAVLPQLHARPQLGERCAQHVRSPKRGRKRIVRSGCDAVFMAHCEPSGMAREPQTQSPNNRSAERADWQEPHPLSRLSPWDHREMAVMVKEPKRNRDGSEGKTSCPKLRADRPPAAGKASAAARYSKRSPAPLRWRRRSPA